MNLTLEQQYQYINWRRRTYLYNKKTTDLLLESKSGQIAQIVAVYVVTGEANDSIPKDVILNLIDEYGEKFFNSEKYGFKLLPEYAEDVIV